MTLRDRVLGVITFASAESGRRFDEEDLALAQDLALRAAAAVENARLYEATASIAKTLQSSLLPPVLPELPGMEIAAAYRPAGAGLEVGGDFYDVFGTAEDQWYAVIGDVCGKGAEAAAVTALARYTIRAAAVRRRSPAGILRWLSDAMLSQQTEEIGRFCTIACLHLDLSRSPVRVTVACGGHPLPIVVRADGTTEEIGIAGTLLGLVEEPDLQDRSATLHEGDAVVLYTDGLTEANAPARVWTPDELAAEARRAAGRPAGELVVPPARGRGGPAGHGPRRRRGAGAALDGLTGVSRPSAGCPSPCRGRSRRPGRRACAEPCRSRAEASRQVAPLGSAPGGASSG